MKIGGDQKSKSYNRVDSDFSSILEESRFSRFKPLLIVVLVVAAVTGGLMYAVPRLQNSHTVAELQPQGIRQTAAIDDLAQFSKCLSGTEQTNPTPDANDSAFYPKLIAVYDAQLGCYDQYPNNSMSGNRSSVERARQGAIDSSGAYKDTYLASNPYQYTPQTSSGSGSSASKQPNQSSGTGQPSETTSPASQPSEWTLNKEELDKVVACADRAFASNPTQGTYGSPSYYEQKITQLRAQLACTDGAKYSLSLQRRTQYQTDISTNQARYNDSINPNSPSYYGNR